MIGMYFHEKLIIWLNVVVCDWLISFGRQENTPTSKYIIREEMWGSRFQGTLNLNDTNLFYVTDVYFM